MKVLSEKKTQSRNLNKHVFKVGKIYGLSKTPGQKPLGKIKIQKIYTQRIFDITEEEANAEGYKNLTEFLEKWKQTNHYLIPWQTITTYQFKLVKL